MKKKKRFNPKEASDYLKVSKRTLQRYRNDGLIEFSQFKRKILFTEEDLEKFIRTYHKGTFINSKNFRYEK